MTDNRRKGLRWGVVVTVLQISIGIANLIGADARLIRAAAAQEPIEAAILARLNQLRREGTLDLGGTVVRRSQQLEDLYARRDYAPIWNEPGLRANLIRAIAEVERDGLTPSDYSLEAILTFRVRPGMPGDTADLDVLQTEALIRLAHDLRHGKVRANEPAAGRACRYGLPRARGLQLTEVLQGCHQPAVICTPISRRCDRSTTSTAG
jgi:murein L,D-transpeptidase YcbB/YkuD